MLLESFRKKNADNDLEQEASFVKESTWAAKDEKPLGNVSVEENSAKSIISEDVIDKNNAEKEKELTELEKELNESQKGLVEAVSEMLSMDKEYEPSETDAVSTTEKPSEDEKKDESIEEKIADVLPTSENIKSIREESKSNDDYLFDDDFDDDYYDDCECCAVVITVMAACFLAAVAFVAFLIKHRKRC